MRTSGPLADARAEADPRSEEASALWYLDVRSSRADGDKAPRMVCIIFVAGHNDRLEREIQEDDSGRFDKLKGMPKALLPAEDLAVAREALDKVSDVTKREELRKKFS